MVPVTSPEEILLSDARKQLLRELQNLRGKGNLDEAFAAWLLPATDIEFQLREVAQAASEHTGGQRTYRDVAILGFTAAAGILEDFQREALQFGLEWVSGRAPLIDGQPMDFCTDPVGLLGISLGARLANDVAVKAKVNEWLDSVIKQSFQSRLDDWQKCLLCAVKQQENSNVMFLPTGSQSADVRVALRSKGMLPDALDSNYQDYIDTLSLVKRNCGADVPPIRAALRLAALDSIQQIAPAISLFCPSIEDVCRILARVPAALRRWTWEERARTRGGEPRKWHIDNEYHVQNLLYLLLAPVFPDLTDEDYTPSVGQMHPRADLGIPCLRLIIEVKFMRSSHSPQDMIEQIAADSGLYLVENSSYSQIVAFIWDDSRRSEQHDLLRAGLRQLRGVVDAVIVSRPGSMTT